MKKHRTKSKQKTPIRVLTFGVIFSITTLGFLSLFATFILSKAENPLVSIKLTSLVVLLLSGAISGIVTAKHKGDLNFGLSILISVSVVLLMLAISLISAKGNVGGNVFMNYVCYFMIFIFFSFISRKRSVRRHR